MIHERFSILSQNKQQVAEFAKIVNYTLRFFGPIVLSLYRLKRLEFCSFNGIKNYGLYQIAYYQVIVTYKVKGRTAVINS